MIEILNNWAKDLALSIILISFLEMLLPNNNTKKYVKFIMGIFILFVIISPLIKNSNAINLNELDLNTLVDNNSIKISKEGQKNMDKKIEELYIKKLEDNIRKTLEDNGYKVNLCKIKTNIQNKDNEFSIKEIVINLENKKFNSKDIENIKKILVKDYGVDEKCLKIK